MPGTLAETLPLGSVRYGREIGQINNLNSKFVLMDCSDCQIPPRWISIYRVKGRDQIPCTDCSRKRMGRARIFNP